MPLDEPSTVIVTITLPEIKDGAIAGTARDCLIGRSARVLLPRHRRRLHRSEPTPHILAFLPNISLKVRMDDLSTYGPLLVSAGLMLVMCAIFGRNSQACRMIAAALCIFLALRYLWWHATLGMPKGQTLPQQVWAWIFFLFESTANFSSTTVYFFSFAYQGQTVGCRRRSRLAFARSSCGRLYRHL
jgi:hypothetical protein